MKGYRAITRALSCAVLLLPLLAHAAFFMNREGRLPLPRAAISYRIDDGSDFDTVAVDSSGWISQRDQMFTAGQGPVRLWAKW